jgi:hypothetical protein
MHLSGWGTSESTSVLKGKEEKRKGGNYYYYYYYYYYTRFVDLAQKLTMELLIFSEMRGGAKTCADKWETNTIIVQKDGKIILRK